MKKQFYILFTFRNAEGFIPFARFEIGDNKSRACELFNQLHGTSEASDKDKLYVELMETTEELPMNLLLKSCSLQELQDNCGIITKAVFAAHHLQDR